MAPRACLDHRTAGEGRRRSRQAGSPVTERPCPIASRSSRPRAPQAAQAPHPRLIGRGTSRILRQIVGRADLTYQEALSLGAPLPNSPVRLLRTAPILALKISGCPERGPSPPLLA
jgi:hypothetical protein